MLHLKKSKNFIKHFQPAKFKTKNSASTTEFCYLKSQDLKMYLLNLFFCLTGFSGI